MLNSKLFQLDAQKTLDIQKKYALSAEQMYKVGALFQTLCITRLPSGNFQVRSLSRPNQFHQVNPKHETCTCEHAKTGAMCFHLAAWKYALTLDMSEWLHYCTLVKNAEIERKHFQDADNAQIISRREQLARIARNSRPRVEYHEELDLL